MDVPSHATLLSSNIRMEAHKGIVSLNGRAFKETAFIILCARICKHFITYLDGQEMFELDLFISTHLPNLLGFSSYLINFVMFKIFVGLLKT